MRGITKAALSVGATAILAGAVSPAAVAAPVQRTASPASICQQGIVKVPNVTGGPIARKPGQVVYDKTSIINTSRSVIPGVTFDYEFSAGNFTGWAPAPAISWRIGKGRWHKLAFSFYHGNNQSLSFWYSTGNVIGTLQPHAKLALEMKASFFRRDPRRLYDGLFMVVSKSCGPSLELGHGDIPFGFLK